MPRQVQKTAPPEQKQEVPEVGTPTERGDKLKADIDALLDEIDSVLEEDAEEFVRAYIQKGGE